MNKVEVVKQKIKSSGSKLVSLKFEKKDGSIRTICFNPKTAKGLKGEEASDSAKRAIATRKKNNPNMISVCDQSLLAKGMDASKCWRTVDLEKVIF